MGLGAKSREPEVAPGPAGGSSRLQARAPGSLLHVLRGLPGWAVLAAGLALPLVFSTGFELSRYQLLLSYVTVAMALNFAFGFAGQLALGQPVLVAVSAYTAGLLSAKLNWDFPQTVLPGLLAAVFTSVLLALPSLRVHGWYYAIVSFFAIAVMPDVITAFAPVTGGESGLTGIKPIRVGSEFAPAWLIYELVFATAVLTWIGIRNLVNSGWGIVLRAMRDHPVAAATAGVHLNVTRTWVYVLLAIPCGMAGVEYAHSQLYITPSNFAFNMILLLIGGVFLGGVGTLWGPALGIAVFQGISFWIGPFTHVNELLLGAGVLAVAVGFRGGIVAATRRLAARVRGRAGRGRDDGEAETQLDAPAVDRLLPIERQLVSLEVEGAAKSFGGNVALRGVNLQVSGGKVVALIGPNGSGKTTLVNFISGLVRGDAGRVVLNGREVHSLPPHRIARLGLGRTFQVPRLVDELTVLQNVELGILGTEPQRVPRTLFRLPGTRRLERERAARARNVCQFLGLADTAIDGPAGSLPLGLKRIVEIARAIAGGAPVVCLDEPAAGLTDAERGRLGRVLRALVEHGRAVLLIEHNTRFVLSVSDEVVLLRDGAVVGRGRLGRDQEMDAQLREYVAAYAV